MGLWAVFVAPGYDRFVAHVAVTLLHAVEAPG